MKISGTLCTLLSVLLVICFSSCIVPFRSFNSTPQPSPPDYADRNYWAALPDKKDGADFQMHDYGIIDGQKTAKADVFYIPPTNYNKNARWNVSLNDPKVNLFTDTAVCRFQASAYNGSCRVYVPRYRTANVRSYFALSKKDARLAFGLAYQDVENAFLYYLEHYNHDRPFIIAAHSQGTDYAIDLLKKFLDKNTSLRKRFIAAYLVGRPIYDTTFKVIKPMDSAEQTGGYVTWNSVSYHTNTFYGDRVGDIVGINPLSWKRDTVHVPSDLNRGSLPLSANRIDSGVADAKIAPSGFLWVSVKPKHPNDYPGINTFYYHKSDYAFYYMNIRENVKLRVENYFKNTNK